MRLRLLMSIAFVIIVVAVAAAPAGAAVPPSVTVVPNAGLVDGQPVTATSRGLLSELHPGSSAPFALECAAGQFPSSAVFTVNDVDFLNAQVGRYCVGLGTFPFNQSNVTTLTVPVRRSFIPPTGTLVQCGKTPGDCVFVVGGFAGAPNPGPGLASAPISFRPEPPRSEAECANDGWQHVSKANGNPFKSINKCISYVRHHG